MQGRVFLGSRAGKPRQYIFASRGRMGSQRDMIRAVRDHRFKYMRNYFTFVPFAFRSWYVDRRNSGRELWRLVAEGNLPDAAMLYMQRSPRPPEELYDLRNDPHEIRNLADSPEHQQILHRMREVQLEQLRATRDLGLMPEWEMHTRIPNVAPYEMARRGEEAFPLERILGVIELHGQGAAAIPQLLALAGADDPAIRYWAVVGLTNLGDRTPKTLDALGKALKDPSVDVQLAAAEALCRLGHEAVALPTLAEVLQHSDGWVRTRSLGLIDKLDDKARPILEDIRKTRPGGYVHRMLPYVLKGIRKGTVDRPGLENHKR